MRKHTVESYERAREVMARHGAVVERKPSRASPTFAQIEITQHPTPAETPDLARELAIVALDIGARMDLCIYDAPDGGPAVDLTLVVYRNATAAEVMAILDGAP